MLTHANGECCAEEHGENGYPEPLSALPADDTLTMGLSFEEHAEGCEVRVFGGRGSADCECENYGFSTQACQACGDTHHGDRYWMTGWVGDRPKI
jgi:hypothetical protein